MPRDVFDSFLDGEIDRLPESQPGSQRDVFDDFLDGRVDSLDAAPPPKQGGIIGALRDATAMPIPNTWDEFVENTKDEIGAVKKAYDFVADSFKDDGSDSWVDVGKKAVENTPTMFQRQAGGLLRGLAEQDVTPGGTAGAFFGGDQVFADATEVQRERAAAPGGAGEIGSRIFDEATSALKENEPNLDPESLKSYAYEITQGILNMAPALAASMATRSPSAGMTLIGAQVGGDRYGESRAAGRSEGESAMDAAFFIMAEAIPERLPLSVLMKKGGGIIDRALSAAGAEGMQEMFTQVLQTSYETGILGENEDMTWGEFQDRIKRAGIVGAGVGAGLAVATQPFQGKEGEPEIRPKSIIRARADDILAAEREAEARRQAERGVDFDPNTTAETILGAKGIDDAIAKAEERLKRAAMQGQARPGSGLDQAMRDVEEIVGEDATEEAESYSFASTQVRLPEQSRRQVLDVAARAFKSEDLNLDEGGLETQPHITLRYGFDEAQSAEVQAVLAGAGKIDATFGPVEIFSPEGKDYEVVVQSVEGESLRAVRSKLEALDAPGETFTDYKPHMTLAYVKKGKGAEYADLVTGLEGQPVSFDTAEFTNRDGTPAEVPLAAPAAPEPFDARLKRGDFAGRLKNIRDELPVQDRSRNLDPKRDDILTAIRKVGGVDREALLAEGVDPADLKALPPGFLRRDGRTLDDLRETLAQDGYPEDLNDFLTAINDSLAGNPAYSTFQETGPAELEGYKDQPSYIRTAIDKAMAGEKLGPRQTEVVQSLLDQVSRDRLSGVAEARAKLAADRERRRIDRQVGPTPPMELAAELVDLYDNLGERFDEADYLPEMDFEARALFDMAVELENQGGNADSILKESANKAEPIASTLESFEASLEKAYGPEATRTDGPAADRDGPEASAEVSPEQAAADAPAEAAELTPPPTPAGAPTDLFGAAPVTAQALADREREKDAKRNSGSTDMTGTMFGGDTGQVDLMDQAGVDQRPAATSKVAEEEAAATLADFDPDRYQEIREKVGRFTPWKNATQYHKPGSGNFEQTQAALDRLVEQGIAQVAYDSAGRAKYARADEPLPDSYTATDVLGEAYYAGKNAFSAGERRVPPSDFNGDDRAAEWLRGWDVANVDEPVPGLFGEPEAADDQSGFEEEVARLQRNRDELDQRVRELFERDGYVRAVNEKDPGLVAMLTPTVSGEKNQYRITTFREGEPTGHLEYTYLTHDDPQANHLNTAASGFNGYRIEQQEPASQPDENLIVVSNTYASGLNRLVDMEGAITAGQPFGVDVGLLSKDAQERVAQAAADGVDVFIDSGAFRLFRENLRKPAGQAGFTEFGEGGKGLPVREVLQRYNAIVDRAEALADTSAIARLHMVMPDLVGDPNATLQMLLDNSEAIVDLIDSGVDVIVPYQRGMKHSDVERILRAAKASWRVGIPSNAAAMTAGELQEIVSEGPTSFHLLGAASEARAREKLGVIRAASNETGLEYDVTLDGNVLRSRIDALAGKSGADRSEAIAEILKELEPTTQQISAQDFGKKPGMAERYRMVDQAEAVAAIEAVGGVVEPAGVKPFTNSSGERVELETFKVTITQADGMKVVTKNETFPIAAVDLERLVAQASATGSSANLVVGAMRPQGSAEKNGLNKQQGATADHPAWAREIEAEWNKEHPMAVLVYSDRDQAIFYGGPRLGDRLYRYRENESTPPSTAFQPAQPKKYTIVSRRAMKEPRFDRFNLSQAGRGAEFVGGRNDPGGEQQFKSWFPAPLVSRLRTQIKAIDENPMAYFEGWEAPMSVETEASQAAEAEFQKKRRQTTNLVQEEIETVGRAVADPAVIEERARALGETIRERYRDGDAAYELAPVEENVAQSHETGYLDGASDWNFEATFADGRWETYDPALQKQPYQIAYKAGWDAARRGELKKPAPERPPVAPEALVPPETAPETEQEAADAPLRGMPLIGTGTVLRTVSGRETAPAPKIEATSDRKTTNSLRRMNAWLLDEARKEVAGNSYQTTLLEAINLANLTQSDQDTINELLFGDADGPTAADVVTPGEAAPTAKKKSSKKGRISTAVKRAKQDYGKNNTFVKKDEADDALAFLIKRGKDLNTGVDPEMMTAVFKRVAFHVEAGARAFGEIVDALVSEVGGDWIVPYLKGAYNNVRDYPGFDAEGMSSSAEVNNWYTENVSSQRDDLERDSGTAAADEVGAGSVQSEPGRAGSGNAGAESAPIRGGEFPSSSSGVSADGPVASGSASDQSLFDDDGSVPVESGAAGSAQSGGGADPGRDGAQIDRARSDAVERASGKAPRDRQRDADRNRGDSELGNAENVLEQIPALQPAQAEDVAKAEKRFFLDDAGIETGFLLTNGTGTGKTFSGLGVIKRATTRFPGREGGTRNILIVAPQDGIINAWVKAGAEFFDLDITKLADSRDSGDGIVATTFANFYQNQALFEREWDLVVYDESHNLLQEQDGKVNSRTSRHFRLTNHPDYLNARARSEMAEEYDALVAWRDENLERLRVRYLPPELSVEFNRRTAVLDERAKAREAELRGMPRPKVLFLSASPFGYHKTLRYADTYLFDFEGGNRNPDGSIKDQQRGYSYNSGNGEDQFFMEHLGYRMRFNKLTQPEAAVDRSLMERRLNEWLRDRGAMSRRMLDIPQDYSREFFEYTNGLGEQIDAGMYLIRGWVRDEEGKLQSVEKGEEIVSDVARYFFDKKWNYHYMNALLEGLNTEESIKRTRKHLGMGREVVVFHRYKTRKPSHPFRIDGKDDTDLIVTIAQQLAPSSQEAAGLLADEIRSQVESLQQKAPELYNMDLSKLANPVNAFREAFGDRVGFYNGDVPKRERSDYISRFNSDESNLDVIVVQYQAGKEGISLHDTTGKKPRALISVGLPVQATDTIQMEGRTYRVGNESNAIYEYLKTGLSFEERAFAHTIAARSSTAENLAMGNDARDLLGAFVNGYTLPAEGDPRADQGTGGKESDRTRAEESVFDQAKSFYWATTKKTSRDKAREGKDYFATPEPVGLKMVEWLGFDPNEKALEPSAGHGAIARWFPDHTRNTFVEPSPDLVGKLGLNARNGQIKEETFEQLNVVNKYHGIAMNPPFGLGGSDAIAHLEKASRHLYDGGRIVAIIPQGPAADKKFDKWFYGEDTKGLNLRMEVKLPSVAFQRAGTAVSTRIVVIDKINPETSFDSMTRQRDLSDVADINELFEKIENMTVPPRVRPAEDEAVAEEKALEESTAAPTKTKAPKAEVDPNAPPLRSKTQENSRTGAAMHMAIPERHLGDQWSTINAQARAMGGRWSRYKNKAEGVESGWVFPSPEKRDAFLEAINGPMQEAQFAIEADLFDGAPPTSRRNMNFKEVSQRIPALTEAAQRVKAGTMTAAEYDALVNTYKTIEPYDTLPTVATNADLERSLTSNQVPFIGKSNDTLKKGDAAGLRLDIPAYTRHGVWVVSVHGKRSGGSAGPRIGYEKVAALTNATFATNEKVSLNIAAGKAKAPMATIEGKWDPITAAEATRRGEEALNSPDWVQVGMDPERHSYFYDRVNTMPIVSADEVVQIGPLVLARNPVYGEKGDFNFGLEASPIGFYSALSRAAQALKQERGTAKQMLAALQKSAGVKQEELEWTGVTEWLEAQDGPVSRQAIVDYLETNGVEVREVAPSADPSVDLGPGEDLGDGEVRFDIAVNGERVNDLLVFRYDDDNGKMVYELMDDGNTIAKESNYEAISQAALEYVERNWGPQDSQYSGFSLPGGENYREILLTLNSKETGYQGGHFEVPDVLAHMRVNDRQGPNGEQLLHIEEIQSDWHQDGRSYGYAGREPKRSGNTDTPLLDESLNMLAVPDAPFKGNAWVELVIKRAIRLAAEGNYDGITWTTGDQQNARYPGLQAKVDYIRVAAAAGNVNDVPIAREVRIFMEAGSQVVLDVGEDGQVLRAVNTGRSLGELENRPLSAVLGSSVADQITAENFNPLISGDGLKMGGDGMRGFYDKTLPNLFKKVARKLDKSAAVGDVTIGGAADTAPQFFVNQDMGADPSEAWVVTDFEGYTVGRYPSEEAADFEARARSDMAADIAKAKAPKLTLHSLPITPAMKQIAVTEGQALWSSTQMTPSGWGSADPGPEQRGMTAAAVVEAIRPAYEKINAELGLQVEVIHLNQLPSNIYVPPGARPAAAVIGRSVYLMHDQIFTARDARRFFAHEVVGHVGVNALVGDQWAKMVDAYNGMKQRGGKQFKDLHDELQSRYGRSIRDRAEKGGQAAADKLEVKEFIAIAAERRLTEGSVGRFMRLVREITQAALRAWGFNKPFSMTDIDRILSASETFVETKPKKPARGSRESELAEAWHGTPHQVDKFSLQKIGTGEGVQAYGYGLYFSSKREVAEWYRDKLTGRTGGGAKTLWDGEALTEAALERLTKSSDPLARDFAELYGMDIARGVNVVESLQNIIGTLEDTLSKSPDAMPAKRNLPRLKAMLERVEHVPTTGKLYQVNVPEQDELLDAGPMTLPANEAIVAKMDKADVESMEELLDEKGYSADVMALTGREFYQLIGAAISEDFINFEPADGIYDNTAKLASEYLHSLGVKGLHYVGGSSSEQNFVIWDESAIEIQAQFGLEQDFDPEGRAFIGRVGGIPSRRQRFIDRFGDIRHNAKAKFRQYWIDSYDSIRTLLNDERSWKLAQLTASSWGSMEAAMNLGQIYLDETGVVGVDTSKKSLMEILAPLGNDLDRFTLWIASNRAERLKAEERENLFKDEDIRVGKALNEPGEPGKPWYRENRKELFESVRQDFEEFSASITKIAVQTGLVNAEEADIWEEQGFYLPFYRILEEDSSMQGPRSMGGSSGLVKQQAFKRLKGSERKLDDLLGNAMLNWNHLLSASMKNQAARSALETAMSMGVAVPVSAKAASKKAVYVRVDGKPLWFEMTDSPDADLVFRSLTAMNWPGFNNTPMRVATAAKRWTTRYITASPEFKLANLIRDSIQAIAVADMSTNVGKNLVEGWKATDPESEIYAQMLAGGAIFGESGYIHGSDPQAIRLLLKKGVSRETILDDINLVKKAWRKYDAFGARLENVNRAANVVQALDAGKDRLEAMFEGRDHVDFSRHGQGAVARVLAQTVIVLNARIQGLDKLARSGVDTKERADGSFFKNQQRQMATVISAYGMMSVLLYLMMKDDDDYQDAEQWERDTYHLFKIPGSDILFRIPRPFEVGAIANMMERAVEQFVDKDAHGALFAERLYHTLIHTFSFNPVPHLVWPALEVWGNKNTFTDRPIESMGMRMQNLSPAERKRAWTSETAIMLSKGMARVDEAIPGDWSSVVLSPVQIEHLVQGYLAWAGGVLLAGTDPIVRELSGEADPPARRWSEYPMMKRFTRTGPPRNTKYTTEFWKLLDDVKRKNADIAQYRRLRQLDKAKALFDKNRGTLQNRKVLDRRAEYIGKLNNQMSLIRMNKDLSPEEKRRQMDELQIKKNAIAKQTVIRLKNKAGAESGESGR